MAKLPQALAEQLEYLSALGWEEIHLAPAAGALAPEVEARARELEALRQQAVSCRACALCEQRQSVVFGAGSVGAPLMFVGEAPGADEDRLGEPFVGESGVLLNRIIEAMGLQRERIYIANIVKCRPPGNRNPLPEEAASCRSFLDRQIDLVRPRVIVALGRVAAHALLGGAGTLGSLRGRWYDVRGIPTRVTYHPAALLRNAAYKRPAWEDFQLARDRLHEVI